MKLSKYLTEYDSTRDKETNEIVSVLVDKVWKYICSYKTQKLLKHGMRVWEIFNISDDTYFEFNVSYDKGNTVAGFGAIAGFSAVSNNFYSEEEYFDLGIVKLWVNLLPGKEDLLTKIKNNESLIREAVHHEIIHAIRNMQGKNYIFKKYNKMRLGMFHSSKEKKYLNKRNERLKANYGSNPEEWDAVYMTTIKKIEDHLGKQSNRMLNRIFSDTFEKFVNFVSPSYYEDLPQKLDTKYDHKLKKRLYDYFINKRKELGIIK